MSILNEQKSVSGPVVVPCAVRTDSPPTYGEGDCRPLRIDANGALVVATQPGSGGSASASAPSTLPEVTVATGAAATISGAPTSAAREVIVQAPQSNTANVYLGASGVTVSTGIELPPGSSISLQIVNAAQLFAISSVAGQKLRVLVV